MKENLLAQKRESKVEEYALHPQAEELARELATNYAASLVLQGKILAFQQRSDEVQSVHIEQARDIISGEQKRGWTRELLLVFGSALVGAFIQGFITELSAGHQLLTAIYVVLGFIGMLLVFSGLRR
jgi:hypothetical protein